ncbi:MAG: hypothetical protein QM758_12330 [Armatimonas sp.]
MNAPWHAASYANFSTETLPALLEKHLGIERAAESLAHLVLPEITEEGWFTELPGLTQSWSVGWVIVPRATEENLAEATVRCVGEQLAAFFDERLTEWHGSETPPLSEWLSEFFASRAQTVDGHNPLAQITHLRRVYIEGKVQGWHPSHVSRVCAIESPEGPNAGRVVSIALGAQIQGGKVIPGQEIIGVSAGCIPFLAHTSDARALMGANMYRQFQRLPVAEPALVQTGNEPSGEDFWCGINLRTAFVAWGPLSHEDSLIVSESAAERLRGAKGQPLGIGDKLANRHGTKGVVGAILPDAEMPHSEDGLPAELVYTFFGVPSRMNHGQLFEAALGAAVARDSKPGLAPAFAGPSREEISHHRVQAGLSEDGMEQLTDGARGEPLVRRSTTGMVYWGRLYHDAADKLQIGEQTLGATEYQMLSEAGANTVLSDFFGGWAQEFLPERLQALGVSLDASTGQAILTLQEPAGETISLGEAFTHPWLPEHTLSQVGVCELPALELLQEAVSRLERMKASDAPPRLLADARKAVEARLWDYADALLPTGALLPGVTLARSGRSVCAPTPWQRFDEIGLPTSLFEACQGASWVLVRAFQTPWPISLVALKPVRVEGDAVRFPVQLCSWLNTDFDGDLLAVFAPSTSEAQEELGQLLSPQAQIQRDPKRFFNPYGGLLLGHGALYGLAELARTPEGVSEISTLLGRLIEVKRGYLTRADLEAPLTQILEQEGAEAALETCLRLSETGFAVTKRSGASFSPFASIPFPHAPESTVPKAWEAWGVALEDTAARLPETEGFASDAFGPAILAAASGARGRLLHLIHCYASNGRGIQAGADGELLPISHGLFEGITQAEWLAAARTYRLWLRGLCKEELEAEPFVARGIGVLARAMRSSQPGIVLARAAASGEQDPLTERDARLLLKK